MRALVVIGVLCVLVAGVGVATASADPYRDQAERIACPAAPPGWTHPSEAEGGRYILTPLTAVAQPDDPTQLFGAPVVQVDCYYRAAGGKRIQVSVRYALPIDLNPWNDFYIGCTVTHHPEEVSTGAYAWNNKDRVYRVVGAKTWSLATFIDELHVLQQPDVPRFEAVTKAMLNAAQPFAHNCSLAGHGGPVSIKSIWFFTFDAQTTRGGVTSSGRTSGSFVTTANPSGSSVGEISNLFAKDFRLSVKSKGRTRSMTIHVGSPIVFQRSYGALLRTNLVVTASNDDGCRKGSKGTLLLSLQSLTPPHVAVRICGQTYLDGKGKVGARIETS